MGLFQNIEELKFNNGILVGTNFKLQSLKSVEMFDKFDTHGLPMTLFLALAFILGFFTYGLTWLYLLWRTVSFFKNIGKSYLSIEFQKPEQFLNITEKNEIDDAEQLITFKGSTTLVDEKYKELKGLAKQSDTKVSFKKTYLG